MRIRKLVKLGAVVLLSIIVFIVYERGLSVNKPASAIVELPCSDLTLGCGDASVQVKTDRSPQVMRLFHLRVTPATLASVSTNSIYVDFAMAGMSMGLNRYRLIQQTDGHWHGEITLPVCVQGRSDWLMEVTVRTTKGEKNYRLAFQATK